MPSAGADNLQYEYPISQMHPRRDVSLNTERRLPGLALYDPPKCGGVGVEVGVRVEVEVEVTFIFKHRQHRHEWTITPDPDPALALTLTETLSHHLRRQA